LSSDIYRWLSDDVTVSESPVPYELPEERVRGAGARLMSEYLVTEGLEAAFARRIRADSPEWFAELGAATGPISHLLEPDGIRCVAIDLNPPPRAFSPMVCADLRQLPLPTARFDTVSAVNCLYFLDDPSVGVREAHRVLRPGGLFLTSAPSRYHDPELRHVLPDWGERSPFDAEEVAEIVAGSFEDASSSRGKNPRTTCAIRPQ